MINAGVYRLRRWEIFAEEVIKEARDQGDYHHDLEAGGRYSRDDQHENDIRSMSCELRADSGAIATATTPASTMMISISTMRGDFANVLLQVVSWTMWYAF